MRFLLTAGTVAASIGVIYTQATFLPFILMERIGLTPAAFGLAMLFQSGGFFLGSLVTRWLIGRTSANRIVAPGLLLVAIGSFGTSLLLVWEPGFLRVMVPVAIYAFGIAFVMPAMTTAALAPFPHIAGAAASLIGFMQMGGGLVMGSLGAALGDPVLAMGSVVPAMGFASCLLYILYRRHPDWPPLSPS